MRPCVENSASGSAADGATGILISSLPPSSSAIARRKRHAASAKIFARGMFLEALAAAISSTHQHRQVDRNATFAAAFERGAGCGLQRS